VSQVHEYTAESPAEVTARMRVAVLWTGLTGYLSACLAELAKDADVLLVHRAATADAPFDGELLSPVQRRLVWSRDPDPVEVERELASFEPNVILVGAWGAPAYRRALRIRRGNVKRIVCMDNPWRGTPRQRLATLIARWYVHPYYDAAFVAGERQADFARRLGFASQRIAIGLLPGDTRTFKRLRPEGGATSDDHRFVYVGRSSPEKGVEDLVAAYAAYRESVAAPWPLVLIGQGHASKAPGVICVPFRQPAELPDSLHFGDVLVLPSRWDHWGVILHEAALAGLPIVATSVCGGVVHLVRNGINGIVVDAGSVDDLASALRRMSQLSNTSLARMGDWSRYLSAQFSPEAWVSSLFWLAADGQAIPAAPELA
jgi:glycosyltransferase involved in cell wall biosynthesis